MAQQRATAYKALIDDVLNADYINQESPNPNYLNLYGERVRRVQIIGVIVQQTSHDLVIDDGTNRLTAKRFNQRIDLSDINTGDPILIIGRPRHHNDTVFLGAEAVKQLDNKDWVEWHHRVVNHLYDRDATIDTTTSDETAEEDTVNYSEDILEAINELDDGDGATTSKVIERSSLDDPEQYIDTLINEGEIFEIRPGQLKVL